MLPRLGGVLGGTALSARGAAAGRLQCQPDACTVTTMQCPTEQHGLQAESLAAICDMPARIITREESCLL